MPRALFLFLLTLVLASPAMARPVSYADGWMFMTMNDGGTNGAALLYSPSSTFAFGPFLEHERDTDGELAGLQFNYLAKRWNNPDSQANFYILSGLGIARNEHDASPSGYIGMEADWEDRRFFTSYENRYTHAQGVREEFQQRARIGIAPYVAEYGGLHTWLMLQADHQPKDHDNFTVTPLIRVFKGAYLGEAGISDSGKILFNFTVTY